MTTTDQPERGLTDFNSSGPKKLFETALGPSWGNFTWKLFCSLLCWGSQIQLCGFVVFYYRVVVRLWQMIGPHLRGRGSQTTLIPGPQNLHFKYGGCGLCILEWLVKYCFFYSQYQWVFVALDHFWPKGEWIGLWTCSAHFVTVWNCC